MYNMYCNYVTIVYDVASRLVPRSTTLYWSLLHIILTLGRWARAAKVIPDWDILGSKLPWWTADCQPGCFLQQSHVRLHKNNPFLHAGCVVNNVQSACLHHSVWFMMLYCSQIMQKFRIKGNNTHSSQERGMYILYYALSYLAIYL